MALQKTEAIFLRKQEIRETSLMLVGYSRRLGKFHGLAKGVRGSRAAVPWYLEPLTLQSVILYERRRSPWVLIGSCDLIDPFDAVRRRFDATAYAAFCMELVDRMTEIADPYPEIFDLLLAVLRALGVSEDLRSPVRYFEVQLLKTSGLLPELSSFRVSAAARVDLEKMMRLPAEEGLAFHLDSRNEEELRPVLQGLFRRALDKDLLSRSFLYAAGVEQVPDGLSMAVGA